MLCKLLTYQLCIFLKIISRKANHDDEMKIMQLNQCNAQLFVVAYNSRQQSSLFFAHFSFHESHIFHFRGIKTRLKGDTFVIERPDIPSR